MNGLQLLDAPMTWDDLEALPDDLKRYELICGGLIATPAPLVVHQYIVGHLLAELFRHVEDNALGAVFPSLTAVRFSLYDVVKPDLMFVAREQWSRLKENYIDGPPDLIVEVLGDNTRRLDRIQKHALYANHGVPEYWLVDPDTRSLVALALTDGKYERIPPAGEGIVSRVLPALRLNRAANFPGDDFPWPRRG